MNINQNKNGFWEFFISHNRFTITILVAAVGLGLFSIIQIPKESNPEVNIPVGTVVTVFPGAGAGEVEELVTNIIEDKILSLEKVKEVVSTSREGLSIIGIEFDAKSDSNQQILDLKDKTDEAKIDLPNEAKDPIVNKVRFSDQPIYTFSMSGPFQVAQLKGFGEDLKDEIERVLGVSKVEIRGGQEREIQVVVDKAKLDRYELGIGQVTNSIRFANADIPTGTIETAEAKYNLRLQGRLLSSDDVKKIPISSTNGSPIFVSDVAQVIDGYQERTNISRLSVDGGQALPSISLSVFKSSGGNILRVVEKVEEKIAQAQEDFLPENIAIEVVRDDAKFIRDDLGNLLINGSQTILIVIFLLFLFLGWREALLAGTAIPLSFLITFIFLSALGLTINFLTLFSLILALGILIDSSIVVVEGTHRHIKSGLPPKDAAILTIRDFKTPLIAGTLTTVFAFVPMLLMSGVMGQFIKHIPITVTIVLLSSLFVSLAIITTLSTRWLKNDRQNNNQNQLPNIQTTRKNGLKKIFAKRHQLLDRFCVRYEKILYNLLHTKSARKKFVIVIVTLFLISLALPLTGILKVKMFPQQDMDFFYIDLKKPPGTLLESTSQIMNQIEEALYTDKRIKSFAVTVGSQAMAGNLGEESAGSHLANIIVNLNEDLKEKSYKIVEQYQQKFNKSIDAEVSVTQLGMGPGEAAPVEIVISGESLNTLDVLGQEFENILKEIKGAVNVQTTIQEPSGEFVIQIDRAKAQLYGVSTVELAQILRTAVSGSTATVIRSNEGEIDVVVKYALNHKISENGKTNIADLSTIESLTIATPKGDIPLGSFTKSELSGVRPSIHHEDGKRVVRVTSFTRSGTQAQEIFNEVEKKMQKLNIPSGYSITMGGEAEDIQQSFNDMFRAMILAVFLIASALILQFNSFRQPLFILTTIPLALIGVFIGLFLMDLPITFPGIIGIVALVGIVVNNAIILIDKINKNRKENMDMETAIIEAGKARMRPIFLTTITTVFGILPVTLSSEMWGPLGFSIIFGLSFSTILTLFVIPMLYRRFARKQLA